MNKRIIALFLVLIMLFSVVACGQNTDTESKPESSKTETSADDSADKSEDSKEDLDSDEDDVTEVVTTYTESELDLLQLEIDNEKVFNSNWNGVNAVHQGFIFMPDKYGRDYSDAQLEEELRRMDDMDLNMVRSYMDPGYAFESRDGLNVTYNWDSVRMQSFYKWLDAMKERGIEVAVNAGWGVGSLHSNVDTSTYRMPWEGVENYSDIKKIYTDWVIEFVNEVIIKRGYDIQYLVMFTEPYHFNNYSFKENGEELDEMNGWDLSVDIIKATDKALKDAGLRDKIKLTGPQIGISSKFYKGNNLKEELNWWISQINDYIDVYTVHWYVPTWPGSSASSSSSIYDDNYDLWLYYLEEVVEIFASTGKPYWFDEWNYGGNAIETQEYDFYAQQIAQTVVAAMNAGVNNIIYWQLFEIVWPERFDNSNEFDLGVHVLGVAPSLYESSVPYKLYYGYALLAKYCGELGSKVYYGEGEKGVYCSMTEYEKDGKKYQNVIVVNTSSLEKKISINFTNKINKNMYRYLFDPVATKPNTAAKMISADKGFKNVKNILQDTIPAGAIVVYSTVKE